MNNTNLHPILHRFQDIAQSICHIFAVEWVVPLFNALISGEPQNSGLQNLASKTRHCSMVWNKAYFGILNCLGITHKYDGQTDRQSIYKPTVLNTI